METQFDAVSTPFAESLAPDPPSPFRDAVPPPSAPPLRSEEAYAGSAWSHLVFEAPDREDRYEAAYADEASAFAPLGHETDGRHLAPTGFEPVEREDEDESFLDLVGEEELEDERAATPELTETHESAALGLINDGPDGIRASDPAETYESWRLPEGPAIVGDDRFDGDRLLDEAAAFLTGEDYLPAWEATWHQFDGGRSDEVPFGGAQPAEEQPGGEQIDAGLFEDEVANEIELEAAAPLPAPPPIRATARPRAVPPANPVPFAPPPPPGSYWPLRTRHPAGRSVAFLAEDGSGVGVRSAGCRFLAERSGRDSDGRPVARWHAGIDLFANVGDTVVACEDGAIVHFGRFYAARSGQMTYQLLIGHAVCVVNYGEVTADSLTAHGLAIGARVRAGQPIGFVSDTSMLHFETYTPGTTTNKRWTKGEPRPPRELLNPTRYLLALQEAGLGHAAGGAATAGAPTGASLIERIQNALASGQWLAALAFAILGGNRDENRLTNLIFFARHPELRGRRIEPHETALRREWLAIRDTLVRPALARTSLDGGGARPAPASGADATTLAALAPLATAATRPTVANALAITKLIAAWHGIPWRVCFTILQHEGGVRLFTHDDGVMQTTDGARRNVLPRIPRPLQLALLGLPAQDTTPERALAAQLEREFHRRLAVQIAAGIQELQTNLQRFNGYVALAYQAYNVGPGWAYFTVSGRSKDWRPSRDIGATQWEAMCRAGAVLLHRSPDAVRVSDGVWQCDKNIPAWAAHFAVYDTATNRQLIAYKYLRRFRGRIRQPPPALTCTAAVHGSAHRQPGTGPLTEKLTRVGALDKLYDPRKLAPDYYAAVRAELEPIADDGLPLKVTGDRLEKVSGA